MVQAEKLLTGNSFVPVTEAQAAELAVSGSTRADAGTPYLVRAVVGFDAKSVIQVLTRPDGDVWVGGTAHSYCKSLQMQRSAVIVRLDRRPRDLYVTFSPYR